MCLSDLSPSGQDGWAQAGYHTDVHAEGGQGYTQEQLEQQRYWRHLGRGEEWGMVGGYIGEEGDFNNEGWQQADYLRGTGGMMSDGYSDGEYAGVVASSGYTAQCGGAGDNVTGVRGEKQGWALRNSSAFRRQSIAGEGGRPASAAASARVAAAEEARMVRELKIAAHMANAQKVKAGIRSGKHSSSPRSVPLAGLGPTWRMDHSSAGDNKSHAMSSARRAATAGGRTSPSLSTARSPPSNRPKGRSPSFGELEQASRRQGGGAAQAHGGMPVARRDGSSESQPPSLPSEHLGQQSPRGYTCEAVGGLSSSREMARQGMRQTAVPGSSGGMNQPTSPPGSPPGGMSGRAQGTIFPRTSRMMPQSQSSPAIVPVLRDGTPMPRTPTSSRRPSTDLDDDFHQPMYRARVGQQACAGAMGGGLRSTCGVGAGRTGASTPFRDAQAERREQLVMQGKERPQSAPGLETHFHTPYQDAWHTSMGLDGPSSHLPYECLPHVTPSASSSSELWSRNAAKPSGMPTMALTLSNGVWEEPLGRAALAAVPETIMGPRPSGTASLHEQWLRQRLPQQQTLLPQTLTGDASSRPPLKDRVPGGGRPQSSSGAGRTSPTRVYPLAGGHVGGYEAYRRPAIEARDGLRRPPSAPSLLRASHPPVIAGGARRSVPLKHMIESTASLAGIAVEKHRASVDASSMYSYITRQIEGVERFQVRVAASMRGPKHERRQGQADPPPVTYATRLRKGRGAADEAPSSFKLWMLMNGREGEQ